ncbi:hypothetical protein BC629DRAFT_1460117 [Irpex lacteus]|nr:hypothetical protein BC629DRAFT_1460117 [Irpex lacteus]
MLVPIQIEAIYIHGLRERMLHDSGAAFVEISVIGQDHTLVKTEVNSAPTAPSWEFKRAIALAIAPSSCIRFAIYRHHRVRSDELIGVVEGTAWAFLDAHYRQDYHRPTNNSKDPHTTVQVSLRIADADHKGVAQNDPKARLGYEEVRLAALDRKHGEHTGEFAREIIIRALDCLGIICTILEHISDFPLCKIACTFLCLVRAGLKKMLEKQQEIDAHMASLLQSLQDAVLTASQSGSDSLKHDVIHLASQCAETLDGWISHNLGAQLIHGVVGSFHERAKKVHKRVSELNLKAEGLMDRQSDVVSDRETRRERSSSPESCYGSPMTPPLPSVQLHATMVFIRSNSDEGMAHAPQAEASGYFGEPTKVGEQALPSMTTALA